MTALANASQELYGIMAEFSSPEKLTRAVKQASARGYQNVEAYSPFPVKGIPEALRIRDQRIPMIVLVAGIAGCVGGFLMQYFASVIAYPLVVGGKPLNSWPAFIPVTFELTILAAAGAAVIALFVMNGLPRPYHPAFNAKNFERATQDRFFLCIRGDDPQFDRAKTREFLAQCGPENVEEIAP